MYPLKRAQAKTAPKLRTVSALKRKLALRLYTSGLSKNTAVSWRHVVCRDHLCCASYVYDMICIPTKMDANAAGVVGGG